MILRLAPDVPIAEASILFAVAVIRLKVAVEP